MPYRFTLKQSVAANARRVATEQIDRALACCDAGGDPEQTIHDLRTYCKKLRGLVRLVRGELEKSGRYEAENARFRDAARGLGAARDSAAMIGTYDTVMAHFHDEVDRARFASIRRALTLGRRAVEAVDDHGARIARFRDEMADALAGVDNWRFNQDGFEAVRPGFIGTYRRGRNAMRAAYDQPTAERFHEWRKLAKYHWYHLRLLERVWKPELEARHKTAKTLGDLLGDHHDLAVLRQYLAARKSSAANQAMIALIDRRAAELVGQARIVGDRLYATKPKSFEADIERWWQARLDEIAAARGPLLSGPTGLTAE